MWKITNKTDFNSKADTIIAIEHKPSKQIYIKRLVPLGTIHANDGF